MPYSNIVFVKIKMEILEDYRFLSILNDSQKGLFLMLITLAGKTDNSICDNIDFIKGRLGLQSLLRSDLEFISKTFPKFNLNNGFWSFQNFEEHHNYITGNSKGNPKELQGIAQNKNKNKNKKENIYTHPLIDDVKKYFTELHQPSEAEKFFDYFESNGWKVGGRAPMKNWKASARNWIRNQEKFRGKNEPVKSGVERLRELREQRSQVNS